MRRPTAKESFLERYLERFKKLIDADLKDAPAGASILTGMKTKDYGGGKLIMPRRGIM